MTCTYCGGGPRKRWSLTWEGLWYCSIDCQSKHQILRKADALRAAHEVQNEFHRLACFDVITVFTKYPWLTLGQIGSYRQAYEQYKRDSVRKKMNFVERPHQVAVMESKKPVRNRRIRIIGKGQPKIRIIGKGQPTIDPVMVAKALGATIDPSRLAPQNAMHMLQLATAGWRKIKVEKEGDA